MKTVVPLSTLFFLFVNKPTSLQGSLQVEKEVRWEAVSKARKVNHRHTMFKTFYTAAVIAATNEASISEAVLCARY